MTLAGTPPMTADLYDLMGRLASSLHFMTDDWPGDPEWIAEELAVLAEYDEWATNR